MKEGESFTLDLNHDGRPDTMIVRKDGNIIEAIDDSGRAANIWNQVSTAYVVSYKGTGLVDRMVIYIDNDGDGKADEMEIAPFPGRLSALCLVRRELRQRRERRFSI